MKPKPNEGIVTKHESFLKIRPSLDHIRVFGSHCSVKYGSTHDKLKPNGYPGRLIGFNTDKLGLKPNGYLIWIPSKNKIVKARNVEFNEAPLIEACQQFTNSYRGDPYLKLFDPKTNEDHEDDIVTTVTTEGKNTTNDIEDDNTTNDDKDDEKLQHLSQESVEKEDDDLQDKRDEPVILKRGDRSRKPPEIMNLSHGLTEAEDSHVASLNMKKKNTNDWLFDNTFSVVLLSMCMASILPLTGPTLTCTVFKQDPRSWQEAQYDLIEKIGTKQETMNDRHLNEQVFIR